MKRSLPLAALLLAGLAPALHAQAMVVRPAAPLDSARAGVRDAVLVLRDSLQAVHAAGAHLRRDFSGASPAALVSRARVMSEACRSAGRTVPATRTAVAGGPVPNERVEQNRRRVLADLDRLSSSLAGCDSVFSGWVTARDGEAVRGYGNRRADEFRAPIRSYEASLDAYLRSLGIRVRPLGSGRSPIG